MLNPLNYLSDHSQVIAWLNIQRDIQNETDCQNKTKTNLEKFPFQYIWTNDPKDLFVKILKSNEIKIKPEQLIIPK